MEKINVLINYHYFPHYRIPIMRSLSNSTKLNVKFISGDVTDVQIKIIDHKIVTENKFNWAKVKNIWFLGKKFLWQKGILKIFLFENYDCAIVLANPYIISSWVTIFIAKIRKKKVLLWGHFILNKDFKLPIKLMYYRLADCLLSYGEWAKQELIKRNFCQEKIFVIFNSLDTDYQYYVREKIKAEDLIIRKNQLFKDATLPVIIFVGRLTIRKKLDLLIHSLAYLQKRGTRANLLIVGAGTARESIDRLIDFYNLHDNVMFIGEIYDETCLAELLALSDVCVSPGDVGLLAMHSLVYGTPVISHDNPYKQMPEFESIIPQKTGDFYQANSIESLANTIENWLDKKKKNPKIQSYCKKIIDERYTPKNQLRIIIKAIDSILN